MKHKSTVIIIFTTVLFFGILDFYASAQTFNEDRQITITARVGPEPPSGGGGGGGGAVPPIQTSVVFTGRAYPSTPVSLLKDGQLVATTPAGPDAIFTISLNGLSSGSYVFSVFGEDKDGRRSVPLTFPITVTSGVITQVSGIFIAPSIAVDKAAVKYGDNIGIFGQTVPEGEVTIAVNSSHEVFVKTVSDKFGAYFYNFDTSVLERGSHLTKSKAAKGQSISDYGKAVTFSVGETTVPNNENNCTIVADLNIDCRVNLIDFSILAYWYQRPAVPPQNDLNTDSRVDLIDFSIMAFYWTG